MLVISICDLADGTGGESERLDEALPGEYGIAQACVVNLLSWPTNV